MFPPRSDNWQCESLYPTNSGSGNSTFACSFKNINMLETISPKCKSELNAPKVGKNWKKFDPQTKETSLGEICTGFWLSRTTSRCVVALKGIR